MRNAVQRTAGRSRSGPGVLVSPMIDLASVSMNFTVPPLLAGQVGRIERLPVPQRRSELAAVRLGSLGEGFHVVPVFDDPAVLDPQVCSVVKLTVETLR